jgi:hypothetical protein
MEKLNQVQARNVLIVPRENLKALQAIIHVQHVKWVNGWLGQGIVHAIHVLRMPLL